MHIATIQKNGIETIEVGFKEFEGIRYLDVRIYAKYKEKDEKRPTKKGVTLKPDQIHELRQALEKAEAAAGEMPETA
ncbi:MAG: transcriptional coactivator p15/PC4 family protein [Gammaproteobacteria bacterium]